MLCYVHGSNKMPYKFGRNKERFIRTVLISELALDILHLVTTGERGPGDATTKAGMCSRNSRILRHAELALPSATQDFPSHLNLGGMVGRKSKISTEIRRSS